MVFGNDEFKKVEIRELYKSQMNGFNDSTLKDYNPMLISSIFKKEFKDSMQEDEFIKSYLESAKIIMEEIYNRQDSYVGINKIFFNYSLVLPTLYLCRHCLELAIKKEIRLLGKEVKPRHNLTAQWNAFREYLSEKSILSKKKYLLNNMGEFIMNIDLLDDNGMRLRYPKQKDNTDSQAEFFWVNTRKIVEQTEKFIKQLEKLETSYCNLK